MKKIIIFLCVVALIYNGISCVAPAQAVVRSSNPNVRLELLFEVDSCKVYRFQDGGAGAYQYLTICKKLK